MNFHVQKKYFYFRHVKIYFYDSIDLTTNIK